MTSSCRGTWFECQYACERTTACVAYNYRSSASECRMLSSAGGVIADSLYVSATK